MKSKKNTARLLKITKPQGRNQDHNVHCGLQDKSGDLWFGTTGEGVYRYDGKTFTHFTEKDGLSDNTVWSILEDKTGNIWVGTADGICRYNGKIFTRVPITLANSSKFGPKKIVNSNASGTNGVWSIWQDKSGKIWLGTTDDLYCYNGTSFTRFLDNDNVTNKNGVHLKWIQSILEDRDGNLWFGGGPGTFEGVCRFDGKSITSFKPNGDTWIRSILEDRNGNLWFGGRHHGICRYDGKTVTIFTEKEGLSNSVDSVNSIIEDKAGNIWFTCESNGVWCYDGKSFENFTTKNGLINNSSWCVLEDKAGNIWVGSRNNGLCRYDGKTFTAFTE